MIHKTLLDQAKDTNLKKAFVLIKYTKRAKFIIGIIRKANREQKPFPACIILFTYSFCEYSYLI